MALSGEFTKSIASGNVVLRVYWSAEQDIANNKSTVLADIWLDVNYKLTKRATTNNPMVINGVTYYFSTPAISKTSTGWKSIKLATVTSNDIAHNADGSKSISMSCDYAFNATLNGTYYGTITAQSGTIALDTIPRASTITSMEGNTIGTYCTINIARASDSFTHQFWYKLGDMPWIDAGKGYDESITFRIPEGFANQLPNSTTGKMDLCLRTYNGNTQIGDDYYSVVEVKVASYSININGITLTGNNLLENEYVQGKSTVSVNIDATRQWGATLYYSTEIDGVTYEGANFTTNALGSGNKVAKVTVTDSRGYTKTLNSETITVQPYSLPRITEFTAERQEDGTTVIAIIKGDFASVNGKNAKDVTVGLKWTIDGETYNPRFNVNSEDYFINAEATFTNVPTDISIPATVTFTDSYTPITKEIIVPTVAVTVDYHESGTGIAFGKVAEEPDLFEVAWKSRFLGGIDKPSKLLYDDGNIYLLHSGQTLTLKEKVSEQENGIVLVFSRYKSTTDYSTSLQAKFIPKYLVEKFPNHTHNFVLASSNFESLGTKKVTITDTQIIGHDDNYWGEMTANGITFKNTDWVLRCVLGY